MQKANISAKTAKYNNRKTKGGIKNGTDTKGT
jgi:hypothetical protein